MVHDETAPVTQEPGFETRRKLMNAAERLFADRGFAGVSVRDITDAANVNSALVGYHFRGKLGLLSAIYREHAEALTSERLRLLSEYQTAGRRPTLEEIFVAFVRPALSVTCDDAGGADFLRLRSVLAAENSELLEQLVAENFDRCSGAFVDAFCSCLPDLTRDDVLWRFHFLLGCHLLHRDWTPSHSFLVTGSVRSHRPRSRVAPTNTVHGGRLPSGAWRS